jgi:hypothetical protein
MEVRETPWMHKYEESKTTQIMVATARDVTACAGRTKYQAAWFLLKSVHGDTFSQSMSPCCKKQAQVSHQITRKEQFNKPNIQITDCIHITILLQIWFPDKLTYSLCLVPNQLPYGQ